MLAESQCRFVSFPRGLSVPPLRPLLPFTTPANFPHLIQEPLNTSILLIFRTEHQVCKSFQWDGATWHSKQWGFPRYPRYTFSDYVHHISSHSNTHSSKNWVSEWARVASGSVRWPYTLMLLVADPIHMFGFGESFSHEAICISVM